ncbi:MAG: MCE family protein [FCB group bacterium]|nr:MCE family protein [FCB group bacterium]
MKRTTTVKWGSLKIGIILMIAIAMMFWASFSGGGTSIFQPKGKFVCYFKNVNGLVPGSPVWMSGVEVGNVSSISFVNLDSLRQVKVVCRLKKSVWNRLTKDARVQLGTMGFLGDKYVEVIPGNGKGPPIGEMEMVKTINAGSAPQMFKAGEQAINDARATIVNLNSLLENMNQGKGTLGQMVTNDQLYQNITKLVAGLTTLTAELQKNQVRIVSSIEKTSKVLENMSTKIDENKGTLGRIINDPTLYDNLAVSTAKLDSILRKINTSEGSLGLLVNDTAMYGEMTSLITRLNNLIADIQKNPRKYFKFSVF